jgi:energy-coupling factor transporter ATP-binding protein EcfA2
MKTRLQRIAIKNFKAFREFNLDLEGRHLLVYGANGSGKSSLYWALHTFLQSGRKPTAEVAKYFDPSDPERLLNIHEADPAANPGEITLTLRDTMTGTDTPYRIAHATHDTSRQPVILKADLASDFVTYRFFFGFSNFRNSEKFDLWPLFEQEILPFCVSTSGGSQTPMDQWEAIRSGDPNPTRSRGPGGNQAYTSFKRQTETFAAVLPGVISTMSDRAQQFYDEHFAADDAKKITFKVGVTTPPSFTGTSAATSNFTLPIIELHIQVAGTTDAITRPQTYLNEAKMTQLALSVRFAASLVNLHESDLKLLVLDDLLVSLDMSNRMKVVEILLSDTFNGYQKIILTHDHGLFREFRRKLGADHTNWCFLRLEGTPATAIKSHTEKTELQQAQDYLDGYRLDEAALCLRKAAESTSARFLDRDNIVDPTKEFTGLREDLRAARNKVLNELPIGLYEKVLRNTPDGHHGLLVPTDDTDLDNNAALDAPTRGKLKCQRKRLRLLLTGDYLKQLKRVKLIDDILACTERVLNPAAHGGNPPLYQKEVADALNLIKQLDQALPAPSAPAAAAVPAAAPPVPAPASPATATAGP